MIILGEKRVEIVVKNIEIDDNNKSKKCELVRTRITFPMIYHYKFKSLTKAESTRLSV